MKKFTFFLLAIAFCCSAAISFAAVPQTISHQGYLANAGGTPANGPVQMVFSIYNVESGGVALWTETQTVQVSNGIYAAALGAVSPIDPAIIDGSLWLGVKVGYDAEMTPRQKLSSVPFALSAASASALSGDLGSGYCGLFDVLRIKRPNACPPLSTKRVFVTSQVFSAALGGTSGADSKCQDSAISAGLSGTYKAWLSGTSRFVKNDVPYVLLNGEWIADNWGDLVDGYIHREINITETGEVVKGYAWTNTKVDGAVDYATSVGSCSGFTSTGSYTNVGVISSGVSFGKDVGSDWTDRFGDFNCSSSAHLYCFEQ